MCKHSHTYLGEFFCCSGDGFKTYNRLFFSSHQVEEIDSWEEKGLEKEAIIYKMHKKKPEKEALVTKETSSEELKRVQLRNGNYLKNSSLGCLGPVLAANLYTSDCLACSPFKFSRKKTTYFTFPAVSSHHKYLPLLLLLINHFFSNTITSDNFELI